MILPRMMNEWHEKIRNQRDNLYYLIMTFLGFMYAK